VHSYSAGVTTVAVLTSVITSSLFLFVGRVVVAAPDTTSSVSARSQPLPISLQKLKLDEYLKNIAPNRILDKMDSSGSGKPDLFSLFEKGENNSKHLVLQLFDLNRDGKIDLVKHFERGKVTRIEMDLDYDSRVDTVSEYDTKNGDLTKKTQADGPTSIVKHYFKNELRKKEVDRNADGKPDLWVYYRNGKIMRTEIDKDFDGKTVRTETTIPTSREKKKDTRMGF
jgi:hypothetical protein